jgi:hypothetical protein
MQWLFIVKCLCTAVLPAPAYCILYAGRYSVVPARISPAIGTGRKAGTGSNFAAFAKLRACTRFALMLRAICAALRYPFSDKF